MRSFVDLQGAGARDCKAPHQSVSIHTARCSVPDRESVVEDVMSCKTTLGDELVNVIHMNCVAASFDPLALSTTASGARCPCVQQWQRQDQQAYRPGGPPSRSWSPGGQTCRRDPTVVSVSSPSDPSRLTVKMPPMSSHAGMGMTKKKRNFCCGKRPPKKANVA